MNDTTTGSRGWHVTGGEVLVKQGSDQRLSASDGSPALMRHRFLPTRAAVTELIVLFGVLLVIERLLLAPGEFAKLQPHPYWLPVILLSLQYGTAEGVLAAAMAILAGFLVGWPTQGIDEEYYRYVIRVWAVPVGWIVSAILIGEIRARQRSRLAELEQELKGERARAEGITQHCHRLEEKILRLEREFAVTESGSVNSLAAALQDLSRDDAKTWLDALARAHRGLIGSGSLSLLLQEDRTVAQVAHIVMPGETTNAAPAAPEAIGRVFEAVASVRRMMSALRSDDARQMDGVAAIAVPLMAVPAGRMLGVIVLETVAPDQFNVDLENRMNLLAREISQALLVRGQKDLVEAAVAKGQTVLEVAEPAADSGPTEAPSRRIGIFPRVGRA